MSKTVGIKPFLVVMLVAFVLMGCEREQDHIALGTLERERIAHSATMSEVLVALPHQEGDRIKEGDVLAQLDDRLQQAMVAKSQAEVLLAQANLDKLRNGARVEDIAAAQARVDQYKAALVASEAEFQRELNLKQKNLISQSKLDRVTAKRDEDRAKLNNALEELKRLTNGTRDEDLRMGQAQLDGSLAQLASEQKKLDDLTIRATRDGILDSLPWNLGERATQGSVVAVVLAGQAPFARVYIPEPHRAQLQIGQEFDVRIDGIAEPVKTQLRWIATEPAFTPYYGLSQSERAHLVYLAEFQLPKSHSRLPNGVPVELLLNR